MNTRRTFVRYGLGYLLVLPACLVIFVFILYPIVQALTYSLCKMELTKKLTDVQLQEPKGLQLTCTFIGLENYTRLWQAPKFWRALGHSLSLVALAVPLEFVLGIGLALLLNQRLRFLPTLRKLALVGWVIPIASQVGLFRWVFAPDDGIVNVLLKQAGLSTGEWNWFGEPSIAFGMIVLMHVWRNAPFFGFTLLAGLQAIPQELYDAAEVDGAGAWERFVYITLPHLRRLATILIIGHVAFTLNDYEFVAIATGGGPAGATVVLPIFLNVQVWTYFNWGYASAVGAVMLGLILLIVIPFLYWQRPME
ncbi:sugar ABC transporter permease [Candidatus Acetothermia bacterium]|nr:sugar ABC transporter permease [Candidatus Acetothermia bacterium]